MKELGLVLMLIIIGLVGVFIFVPANKKLLSPTLWPKISVAASFYPLAEFARNVGGDYATVTTTTPAGAEPHDYEPTPQDIVSIRAAKVFVYNGNGVDAWADKIAPDLQKNGVIVLKMSDHVESLRNSATAETETEPLDPHFWLDPVIAQTLVGKIADALVQADPAHADRYRHNAQTYITKLADLDTQFKRGLTGCRLQEIVVSHDAFHYLSRRYGLTSFYISGISPDEEPSAKRIAQIAQLAKVKQIKYIFFETLVSPKLSQTVANEIGAQTLVLNPLEGLTADEVQSGNSYMTVMADNLTHLRTALACQ